MEYLQDILLLLFLQPGVLIPNIDSVTVVILLLCCKTLLLFYNLQLTSTP